MPIIAEEFERYERCHHEQFAAVPGERDFIEQTFYAGIGAMFVALTRAIKDAPPGDDPLFAKLRLCATLDAIADEAAEYARGRQAKFASRDK